MTSESRARLATADWSRPWRPNHGYGELSRFASVEAAEAIGLDLRSHADRLQAGGPVAVLADLFTQLSKRGWAYDRMPWHADRGQLIRDPVSISRGSGTCLDLSLLLCAMAKQAGLRPYLAIARTRTSGVDDHAFVVIDVEARSLDRQPRRLWEVPSLAADPNRVHPGDAPFWASFLLNREQGRLPESWLAIDATHACDRHGKDVRGACEAAEAVFTRYEQYLCVDLIDIVGAHASGYDELPANDDAQRPALFATIPVLHDLSDARRELIEELADSNGYLVLTGEPGSGKSVTANLIASRAAGGSGWFLSAEDPASFKVSLAEAAMVQLGQDPAGLEGNTIGPFADVGYETLRAAESRWVVVLDNADSPPEAYGRLPKPKPNQLVIITTTADEPWAQWAATRSGAARVVTLPALTTQEARDLVDGAEEIPDIPGTPLLINLAVKLHRAGLLGPGREIGDLVADALDGLPSVSRESVRSLGWLPPIAVPVNVLCEDRGQNIADLVERGLAQYVDEGAVQMHRSVRQVVRDQLRDNKADAATLARLLGEPGSRRAFESAATLPDLQIMAAALGAGDLPDRLRAHCLYLLGTFQERQNTKASAAWFEHVLCLLPPDAGEGSAEDAAIVCGCLQGIARSVFRSDPADTWPDALARLDPVERLAHAHPTDPSVQLAASRAEAMVGILRGRLATSGRIPDEDARRREQLAALELVRHSARRRAELVDRSSPDIDRSLFNIPGNLITLAKSATSSREAVAHLREAREIYEELYGLRVKKYRTEHSDEVITCLHGAAITRYLEAVLDDALPAEDRLRLLAKAYEDATRALVVRQGLADDALVTTDTVKTSALVAKIQLLVTAIGNAQGKQPNGAVISAVLEETQHEIARAAAALWVAPVAADSSMPALASKHDAVRFVDYLISRPELWALAEAFGDGLQGLARRRRDLAELVIGAAFGDPRSTEGVAANAQAGRVLSRWVTATPMRVLPGRTDLAGRLQWLRDLAQRWDMRCGLERDYIPTSGEMFSHPTQTLIYALARAWHMLEPAPVHGHFDHAVVLGGLIRANVNRPATLRDLIAAGTVSVDNVIALAGQRSMSVGEIAVGQLLGCPDTTEEGSLRWGVTQAFATPQSTWSTVPGNPHMQQLTSTRSATVILAAAPPSAEGKRAQTESAFEWLMRTTPGLLGPSGRILSITTGIYWIDGHIRLLKNIPEGTSLVTTGSAPRPADPIDPLSQVYLSQHYLQEFKSALDALPGLLAWAQG